MRLARLILALLFLCCMQASVLPGSASADPAAEQPETASNQEHRTTGPDRPHDPTLPAATTALRHSVQPDGTQPSPRALPSGCRQSSSLYLQGPGVDRKAKGRLGVGCNVGIFYDRLSAFTDLYRFRWYGDEFLDADSSTNQYASSVESVSQWTCFNSSYDYLTNGVGEAQNNGGPLYSAYTADQERLDC